MARTEVGNGGDGELERLPLPGRQLDIEVGKVWSAWIDEFGGDVYDGDKYPGAGYMKKLRESWDQMVGQAQQLVKSIREDPKKYLVIRMKIF